MGETEILDHAYLTIEDFLNSKHISTEAVNQVKRLDEIELHFNKPGFDLAIVITDKSLMPTIFNFQCPFQYKFGLTTHVIYLPDISRLKFCIKDLKQHEILYVIVVSENSQIDDDYDVFVLSPIIEHQRRMRYEEMINLIEMDQENYLTQVKEVLKKPTKHPHPNNKKMLGFIEPNHNVRYLLCLLSDSRLLKREELMTLSSFVAARKLAITNVGNRDINYALADRPIPPYRQEKMKYYIYEFRGNANGTEQQLTLEDRKNDLAVINNAMNSEVSPVKMDVSVPQSQYCNVTQPTFNAHNVPLLLTNSTMSHVPLHGHSASPSVRNVTEKPRVSAANRNFLVQPLMNLNIQEPVSQYSLNHIGQTNPPIVKINPQPQTNPVAPPFVAPLPTKNTRATPSPSKTTSPVSHPTQSALVTIRVNTALRPVNPCPPQSSDNRTTTSNQTLLTTTPSISPIITKNTPQIQEDRTLAPSWIDKIVAHCQEPPSVASQPNKPAATQNPQIVIIAPQPPTIPETPLPPLPKDAPNVTQPSHSNTQPVVSASQGHANESQPTQIIMPPVSLNNAPPDGANMVYLLSPVSDDSRDEDSQTVPSSNIIEIDLTSETAEQLIEYPGPPAKKPKHNPPQPLVPVSEPSVVSTQVHLKDIDLRQEQIIEPTSCKVSCRSLVNLLKFVISISPFSLPPQNVVISTMKKALADLERFMNYSGLRKVPIDIRACKTDGAKECLRIIELVTGDTLAPRHNRVDIEFMWKYFPRNVTEDSVTAILYQLLKMVELCKLGTVPNDILATILQKTERVVFYNFQLTEASCPPGIMNFFPSLFTEYFDQRADLHVLNLSLPAPESPSVTLNSDLDKTILENRIKFVVGPLLEYFIGKINSIHYQLDLAAMTVIFESMRTLRFCLRKIAVRLLPDPLPALIVSGAEQNVTERALEMLDEVNSLLREVSLFNCVLFTRRHYDFVHLILDFAMKVEASVTGGNIDGPDLEVPDNDQLIDLDSTKYLQEFSTNLKTAILPFHPDAEIDVLKRALKNRWVDALHQAFKGIPPCPDGGRILPELTYLLPKCWGKQAYNEAVEEAAKMAHDDWDRMLTNDFARSRQRYNEVRNNYLTWLAQHGLDHRKAVECMTMHQRVLDAKVVLLCS